MGTSSSWVFLDSPEKKSALGLSGCGAFDRFVGFYMLRQTPPPTICLWFVVCYQFLIFVGLCFSFVIPRCSMYVYSHLSYKCRYSKYIPYLEHIFGAFAYATRIAPLKTILNTSEIYHQLHPHMEVHVRYSIHVGKYFISMDHLEYLCEINLTLHVFSPTLPMTQGNSWGIVTWAMKKNWVVQGKTGMNFYPVIWGFPRNGGFPQQPRVFLLKMIIFIFWGVFLGGTTILRKHPYGSTNFGDPTIGFPRDQFFGNHFGGYHL